MRRAERTTGTIRAHRRSIAYLSGALVLASAGTASAAVLSPAAQAAVDPPIAAEQQVAFHAGAAGARLGPAGLARPLALTHPLALAHPLTPAHSVVPAHSAAPGRPATLAHSVVASHSVAAHHVTLRHRPAPAADRLLPVTTAGPQNFMPITPAQYANATTIVHQALAKRMGARSAVIAVATAMQESRLLNLAYGTGHSLGLFQQQWDMGWGSPQQIMNPAYAAGKFLDALHGYQAADPAWASQPLYQSAQGVQRSGFPYAYAQWERQAAQLTASVLHAR